MNLFRSVAALLLVVSMASVSFADEAWSLLTSDFQSESAILVGIDEKGLHLSASGVERVVAPSQFILLERPGGIVSQASGAFILQLTGGDSLSGDPVSMTADSVVWRNRSAGEMPVLMSRVVALYRPGKSVSPTRPNEDVVALSNGDIVRGIVTNLTGTTISVKPAGADEATPVPLESVALVQFASIPGNDAAKPASYRIRLDDGSAFAAPGLSMSGTSLSFTPAGGDARQIPIDRVVSIEQMNGPVVWLSSLLPSENVYVPFLGSDQNFPARMDQTVDGSRDLRFGGQSFRRAIGVHSYSRIVYPLDGKFAAFRTQYAIDENRSHADVTLRLKLDDKVVHEAAHVRAGFISPVVLIDLGAAKTLTLEVDYGDGLHVDDHLTWLEPALLRSKPAPVQKVVPALPASTPATAPTTQN